jgi:hypothetical protein
MNKSSQGRAHAFGAHTEWAQLFLMDARSKFQKMVGKKACLPYLVPFADKKALPILHG